MCRDERQYSSITVGTRDSKAHKENEVECHNISWPISMAISYGDASATPGMGLMVVGGVGGDRFTKSGQEPTFIANKMTCQLTFIANKLGLIANSLQTTRRTHNQYKQRRQSADIQRKGHAILNRRDRL